MRSSNAVMPMPRNVRALGASSCARLKRARASSQCLGQNSRTASSTMRRYCSSAALRVPCRGVQGHRQRSGEVRDSAIDQRSKHLRETLTKSLRRVTLHRRAFCPAGGRVRRPWSDLLSDLDRRVQHRLFAAVVVDADVGLTTSCLAWNELLERTRDGVASGSFSSRAIVSAIAYTMSRPIRLAQRRADPSGAPQPSRIAVSIPSALAMPDSSVSMPCSRYGTSRRFAT